MAQTITIDIDAQGNVRVEGHDIAGSECTALTKEIEAAIGETTRTVKKAEYHQPRQILRKVGA